MKTLTLTNARYRLTMELRCKTIILSKDEIQKLKVQNIDIIGEHQNLVHELSITEKQIESLSTNFSHNSHQRKERAGNSRG